MDRLKESCFCRFMAKILIFLMVIQGMPLLELSQSYQWSPQKYVDLFTRVAAILSPAEAHAAAPVADAGSDKSLSKNQPVGSSIALDGSGSYDPDGDSLTCEWYGPFTTTSGSSISKSISEGTYTVSLVVDDGMSRSDIDTAEITIAPCFNISARAKSGKVQLTWTNLDGAERYNIYRANESDPFTFVPIGSTTSTYSTYLDEPVANETTYLYVVGALSQGEWCHSNVISSHPTAIRTRVPVNYAPVIYSSPITHGTTGIIYNYDVNAADPNGDALSYSLLVSSVGMDINPLSGLVTWIPHSSGSYDVNVDVTDSNGGTDTQAFTIVVKEITAPNRPPVADAGPDQTVSIDDTVTLDGSASSDVDGDALTYQWLFTSIPSGSGATLSDTTAIDPTFEADLPGTYLVQLIVSDGALDSDPDSVVITTENRKPIADAGSDQGVNQGDTVQLNGGASSDPDGDALTYSWLFTSAPSGSTATISNPAIVNPTFITNLAGTYVAQLIVNDGMTDSDPDTVTITATEQMITVPDFVGMAQAAAEAAIIAANLSVGNITTQNSATVPTGHVISHDPSAGASVTEGSAVDLVISLGPVMVTVPDVVGQPQADAEAAIVAAGLTVGTITTANSDTVPAGDVMSQSPVAAVSVLPGTAVDLAVSLGPAGVDPDDIDDDFDGFTENEGDCDDSNPNVYPGALDVAGNGIDEDCDGSDADTSIQVKSATTTLVIPVGATKQLGYTVDFDTVSSDDYTISLSHTITPDTGGISLSTNFPSDWSASFSTSWLVNATITADNVGTYELTTVATIQETGQSDQKVITVNVKSDVPVLLPLGGSPGSISLATPTDVIFTTTLLSSTLRPNEIQVEEVDESGSLVRVLGDIVDDGTSGDLQGGDYVYSGTFSLSSTTEGRLYFQARAIFPGISDPVHSETYTLHVTRFPTYTLPEDMSQTVEDPATGAEIVSNRVLVSFVEGTDPDRIEAIVDDVGGIIVGTILELGYYEIEIPGTGDATGVNATIVALTGFPEVQHAEPVGMLIATTAGPPDPYCQYQQSVQQARVHGAWVVGQNIGQAGFVIAILDTGVDYNHPDLNDRIIRGRNLIDNLVVHPEREFDPIDNEGHGTAVAGVLAAEANNTYHHPDDDEDYYIGIAGVTWFSPILAVKVADACPRENCNFVVANSRSLGEGILYAVKQGARILNISLIINVDFDFLRRATAKAIAKGALIVAGAGNEDSSQLQYPAAYPDVLAVGATEIDPDTGEERRASVSSYGDWVDIAAPGKDVLTTLPTYRVKNYDPDVACNYYGLDDFIILNEEERNLEGCYGLEHGTSIAAPIVAGAAALVWGKHPEWEAADVQERLKATAVPMPPEAELGAGRIDVFEAVFNGSFELGDLSEWSISDIYFAGSTGQPVAGSVERVGPFGPSYDPNREDDNWHMAYLSNEGPDLAGTKMSQTFFVPPGIESARISFRYRLLSEEYPNYTSTSCPHQDHISILLSGPSTTSYSHFRTVRDFYSYNTWFESDYDIGLPGHTEHPYVHGCPSYVYPPWRIGEFGYTETSELFYFYDGPGLYTLSISVMDPYDLLGDTVVLIDSISFE